MTQLEVLMVVTPIWIGGVVLALVWTTNYFDDRAMKREQAARQAGGASRPELEVALVAVRDAIAESPTLVADPTPAISKISDEIHAKIDAMAGPARRTSSATLR